MSVEREEPGKVWAGILAVAVHAALIGILIFGVSWQNRMPGTTEVELWSSLPAARPARPVQPVPPPPEPEVKKPELPKKVPKETPKHKDIQPTQADIDLKAKRLKEERLRKEQEEQQRKEEKLKKQLKLEREERAKQDMRKRQEKMEAQQRKLAEAQQQQAAAQRAAQLAAQQAARNSLVKDYADRIIGKIKPYINNQSCQPLNDPEVRFDVTMMPTGELLFDPKLSRSSGSSVCDQAIERAIMRAQPFPKPDAALNIRDVNLVFRPNRPN